MKIAMLLHKSVEHDSRVRRTARALAKAGDDIAILHLPRGASPKHVAVGSGIEVISVTPVFSAHWPKPFRLAIAGLAFIGSVLRTRPDCVHAHDAAMLVPGWFGARLTGALLVYDSHELATGVPYRDRLWGALVAKIEGLIVPRCDLVITVSDGIARILRDRYSLPRLPVVVRNFPDPDDYRTGRSPDLRARHQIPSGSQLALHLGAAASGRGCETLVRSLRQAPETHLLFLGASVDYSRGLQAVAQESGVGDRIHFQPPVPMEEVLAHAEQASVGVSLLEDSCENHRLALPNKVFEYKAAGVPVIASDLPELRSVLRAEPDVALVDPTDEDAIGAALRRMGGYREESTSSKAFLWDGEAERLTQAYDSLAKARGLRRAKRWSIENRANRASRKELVTAIDAAVGEDVRAGARVLDSGCGTGWLLEALIGVGAAPEQLCGIDQDRARVQAARLRVPGAKTTVADMTQLPHPDESFDLVFFIVSLSSASNRSAAVKAIGEGLRVLRPGGALLLYEPRYPNPLNRETRVIGAEDMELAGARPKVSGTLTVMPPLARRLGRATPVMIPMLSRIQPLRTHRLFLHRK